MVLVKSYFTFIQIFYFLKRNPTLIFLSVTSVIAFMSWRTQRHLTRAKYTMDFQVSFSDSETMKKSAKSFRKHFSRMSTLQLRELASGKKPVKQYKRMSDVLNAWERVAVALKHDVYDEEMLYDIYGTFLIKLWDTVNPFVKERQLENPRVYVNLEWLAMRWKIRRNASLERKKRLEEKKLYKDAIKRSLND